MNYIFYTYLIAEGCKGKYKFFQIAFAAVLFLDAVILSFRGILNCFTAKSIAIDDVLSVILFLYFLFSLYYAATNKYTAEDKVKVENNSAKQRTAVKSTVDKEWNSNSILPRKRYNTEIKSSPKSAELNNEIKNSPATEETKNEEAEKNITPETPVKDSKAVPFDEDDLLKDRF